MGQLEAVLKRLFTSYFAKSQKQPLAVAISVTPPWWNRGLAYCAVLAPTAELVKAYKSGTMSEEEYSKAYVELLNSRGVTPEQVVETLPDGAVLLCYEKAGDFCHRHLAAKWLGAAAIITEL